MTINNDKLKEWWPYEINTHEVSNCYSKIDFIGDKAKEFYDKINEWWNLMIKEYGHFTDEKKKTFQPLIIYGGLVNSDEELWTSNYLYGGFSIRDCILADNNRLTIYEVGNCIPALRVLLELNEKHDFKLQTTFRSCTPDGSPALYVTNDPTLEKEGYRLISLDDVVKAEIDFYKEKYGKKWGFDFDNVFVVKVGEIEYKFKQFGFGPDKLKEKLEDAAEKVARDSMSDEEFKKSLS